MRTLGWLLSLVLWGATAQTINFDAEKPGAVPPGWTAVAPGDEARSRWQVIKDASAPSPPYVFAQTSSDAAASRFPLAILDRIETRDGELSVHVKPVGGKQDRAGGLVWRYRDLNNYYLLQANSLQNTIVLYKVQNGKRTPLASKGASPSSYGVKHAVPANEWSVLKVQFRGPLFSVYFNHRRLFEVQDSTFSQRGKVGLWTKADSVTYFDDFHIAAK